MPYITHYTYIVLNHVPATISNLSFAFNYKQISFDLQLQTNVFAPTVLTTTITISSVTTTHGARDGCVPVPIKQLYVYGFVPKQESH